MRTEFHSLVPHSFHNINTESTPKFKFDLAIYCVAFDLHTWREKKDYGYPYGRLGSNTPKKIKRVGVGV